MNGQNGKKGGIGIVGALLIVFVALLIFGDNVDANGTLQSLISAIKVVAIVGISMIAALILIAIIIAAVAKRKDQKLKEEEQKAAILNAPLETFGDLETQALMDKYDGKKPEETENGNKEEGKGFVNPYSVKGNTYEQKGSH